MKVFFLVPYPIGKSPSQRFRFEQYLPLLEQSDIECPIQSFWNEKTWGILYMKGHYVAKITGFLKGLLRRVFVLNQLRKADWIFIHRECLPVGPPVLEWIISKVLRKKIIFDFDDSIWLPNTSAENKLVAFIKWHSKTASICRWSYTTSCGNSFLASYAQRYNQRVVINPTTIDTEHLHNPALHPDVQRNKDTVVMGWTGTHSTLRYLDAILPALQQLEFKYGNSISFNIIANKNPELPLKHAHFIKWTKETEIRDLLQFDIGLMPLANDLWSKGKCGFKALQYMSLEIPTVASPVGVNNEIIMNGHTGYLCGDSDTWYTTLDNLIQQENLRASLGKVSRQTVVDRYSVLSNASNFLSLFKL